MKAPAINLDVSGVLALAAIAAVAVVAGVLYTKRKEIGRALDITSSSNVAASAVDGLVENTTGGARPGSSSGESSLGGLLARAREWVTGTDRAIEQMKAGTPAAPASWDQKLANEWTGYP